MPSNRQLRVIGLITLLLVLTIYYITNGAKNTHDSPFYQKTLAHMEKKKSAAERESMISEEKERLERVERLRKEHDVALSSSSSAAVAATEDTAGAGAAPVGPQKQKPIVAEESSSGSGEKSVAGRKKMGGGGAKDDGKIVQQRPKDDTDDGVAKVGNVAAKTQGTGKSSEESEEEQKVEVELNDILKKGPIIVFSKSYCPFSKKAKHILQDLYTISPPPYVVELDHHDLGPGLQTALQKSTGRRTVPNVLINGKSIGGGDDIEALHTSGKLIDTVTSMGGKRIMSVIQNATPKFDTREENAEVKFKA